MIAKVSVQETTIEDEMMNCPYSLEYLSEHGRQPDAPAQRGNHRDGCGMAFIHNNSLEIHKRDREHAWDASYIQTAKEASSKLFIAHNRLTSSGLKSNIEGSHPFELSSQGVTYAFSHNGTIYDFVDEAKKKNISDSFIFFRNLISTTESNTDESIIKRITDIAEFTEFNSMTAFLLAPDRLLVWRIFDDRDYTKYQKRNMYYTMYMKFRGDHVLFSSEPLDDDEWMLLSNNSFISVKPARESLEINYRLLF